MRKKQKNIRLIIICLSIIISYTSIQNYFGTSEKISSENIASELVPIEQNTAGENQLPVSPTINSSMTEKYMVDSVVDGDTIKVLIKGIKTTVRIIGIDTPEVYATRTGYQECYGKEASDFAKKLLTGVEVQLETDPSQDKKDKYGRLLAHVFFSGGLYYEEESIKNGYGFYYLYRTPAKYDVRLQQAEIEAKTKNLGVWSNCNGVRKPIDKKS